MVARDTIQGCISVKVKLKMVAGDDAHDCRDAGGRAIKEKIAEDARVSRSPGKGGSDQTRTVQFDSS